jgi:hypothetical protein
MPSHLSDIGFSIPADVEEFTRLTAHAAEQGEVIDSPRGYYIRWSPGAGAELWAQANKRRELIGCNPHFTGTSRIRAGITQPPIIGTESPLSGSLYCWAGVTEDEPAGGVPMVIDLPDLDLVRERIRLPAVVTMQVAAFAHHLNCYADDEEFHSSQAEGLKFAAESYIPSGTFTPDLKDREPPQAEAIFAGHILEAEIRTNPYTGQPFQYLSVRTLPGIVDVVADPAIVQGQPLIGGVAHGTFWLSGRIVSDLPPAQERNLLARLFSRS